MMEAADAEPPFECTPARGSCGIKVAALPDGSEALLPDWAKERLRGALGLWQAAVPLARRRIYGDMRARPQILRA